MTNLKKIIKKKNYQPNKPLKSLIKVKESWKKFKKKKVILKEKSEILEPLKTNYKMIFQLSVNIFFNLTNFRG